MSLLAATTADGKRDQNVVVMLLCVKAKIPD
jgi:hypothetical protein